MKPEVAGVQIVEEVGDENHPVDAAVLKLAGQMNAKFAFFLAHVPGEANHMVLQVSEQADYTALADVLAQAVVKCRQLAVGRAH